MREGKGENKNRKERKTETGKIKTRGNDPIGVESD